MWIPIYNTVRSYVKTRFLFFQDFLFALCGFIFYLSIGSKIISYNRDQHKEYQDLTAGMATGTISVICSATYLIDSVFASMKIVTRLTKSA